jgi:hypothetical protein
VSDTKWKRHGTEWRLYRDRRIVGRVVPDAVYPGVMWRVQLPSGLSDMVNLTRAKRCRPFGLAERAESEEKPQRNQGPFLPPSSLVRLNGRGVSP